MNSEENSDSTQDALVVAIGASAGGLQALESIFKSLEPLPNLSIVIVQHLSPEHDSMMIEILGRLTHMPIHILENGMELEPGCVYLNLPRVNVLLEGNKFVIQHLDQGETKVPRQIDALFESLVSRQGKNTVGVVLSGTGTDGASGLKALGTSGALTIVQDPQDALFDGMPRAALATTPRSLVVRADQLPEVLHAHISQRPEVELKLQYNHAMSRVLELLQDTYKVNFVCYKQTTITRRIARRITLLELNSINDYLLRLRVDSQELEKLFHDLLIGVTSFFRDPEAFDSLEHEVLPTLAAEDQHVLRVWIAACASGEEAYSVAMLLDELIQNHPTLERFTLFATDIHPESLKFASAGVYPSERMSTVSPERLSRYFDATGDDSYQVKSHLRQQIIFAPHDLLTDPPFTKLDLICCRNVLIYLSSQSQEHVFFDLHHSLRVNGVLFLGPSETLGSVASEFEEVEARWKIFRKHRDVRLRQDWSRKRRSPLKLGSASTHTASKSLSQAAPLNEAYDALLSEMEVAGFLLNEHFEVLHVFGNTHDYIGPMTGRVSLDLFSLLSPDLTATAKKALKHATQTGQHVRVSIAPEHRDGRVELEVRTLATRGGAYYLLKLEQGSKSTAKEFHTLRPYESTDSEEQARDLERELIRVQEYLQQVTEQGEAQHEELQAANEELQATNEELQSMNEELQSTNEELYTINEEYVSKIKELNALQHDLHHLLSLSEITALFLDQDLCIRRYSDSANLLELMPQDIGRPLINLRLGSIWPTIYEDIMKVQHEGTPWHTVLRHEKMRRWYLCRVLPYKKTERVPEGVLVSMVDITEQQEALFSLEKNEQRLRLIMDTVNDGYWDWTLNPDGGPTNTEYLSPKFKKMFGYEDHELENSAETWSRLILDEDYEVALQNYQKHIETDGAHPYEQTVRYHHKDGSIVHVICRGVALKKPDGTWDRMVGVHQDVTKLKQQEARLRQANKSLEQYASIVSHDLQEPVRVINNYVGLLRMQLGEVANEEQLPSLERYLGYLSGSAQRLTSLIRDLLTFSRSSNLNLPFDEVDMNKVILVAKDSLQTLWEERDVDFEVHSLPKVWGNASLLAQVMQNLMANAIEYSSADKPVWLRVFATEEGSNWRIHVRDRGKGIDAKYFGQIFEPFQRVPDPKDAKQGTGIGLSIAKRILDYHDSSIDVESTPGQGSTFSFVLPQSRKKI